MSERLKSIGDIPKVSRWDGQPKYFTGECLECNGYERYFDGEVCSAGVAWKVLVHEKEIKTCSFKKQIQRGEEADKTSKPVKIVYTPEWIDFVDGTMDELAKLGFVVRFAPEDSGVRSGFSMEEFK